jgi:serine/threonine-protein kinase
MEPTRLGGYELQGVLGEGGMGKVYRALDPTLDRPAAIKVVHPKLLSDEGKERFLREARACSKINHPNIITVYGAGEENGMPYMAMEFIQGRELRDVVKEGAVDWARAVRWTIELLDALVRLHGEGIVHRDLKPENIMVTDEGLIKVMDFGLVHLSAQTALTAEGTTLGTAPYMSPEQVEGRKVDTRSDLFSIATILYEMVAGEHPYFAEHPMAIMFAIKSETPKPLATDRGFPEGLQAVLDRAFKKEPGDRFQTAEEFRDALAALLPEGAIAGGPSNRRVAIMVAVAAVVVLAVGLGAWKIVDTRRAEADHQAARQHNEKGDTFLDDQNWSSAEREFREAIIKDEHYAQAHHNLGITVLMQRDTAEAVSSFGRAAALDSAFADPRYMLGVLAEARGDVSGAERRYRDAIAADPKGLPGYNNLAALLLDLGRASEAGAVLDAGLAQDTGGAQRAVRVRMLEKRGRAALALGDSSAAADFFERSRELSGSP